MNLSLSIILQKVALTTTTETAKPFLKCMSQNTAEQKVKVKIMYVTVYFYSLVFRHNLFMLMSQYIRLSNHAQHTWFLKTLVKTCNHIFFLLTKKSKEHLNQTMFTVGRMNLSVLFSWNWFITYFRLQCTKKWGKIPICSRDKFNFFWDFPYAVAHGRSV